MIFEIIKRNGETQPFDPEKLNKWAIWASENCNVDWGSIALDALKKCFDKCTTTDLQNAMIGACLDKEDTAHLKMAGRLLAAEIYKNAFGGIDNIPSLKEQYHKMIGAGRWDSLMDYSDKELEYLETIINHKLDLESTYTELKQISDKYLIKDRVNNKLFESPQFMYMRMALGNMFKMPKERRINDVVALYNYLSKKKINPPSPFINYLGTSTRTYASCCVYTSNDTIPSLAAGDHIAYMMTVAAAGIGAHVKTRSKGDKVRGGRIKHLGKLPYYRMIQSAVSANKQGDRGGAATVHYNVLDPEIEDLIRLRNPTTVEQKRIKDIDYSFGYNKFFAEKVAKNEDWMLVSYGDNPELYEAMYSDDLKNFKRLYKEHEKSKTAKKTFVKARKIALMALTEAIETRNYLTILDQMNHHTPFKDTIYSSNLCQEIDLPTKPFLDMDDLYSDDPVGEIGLCNIGSIVAGNTSIEEYEDVAYYTALMIDNVIEIMDYPFPSLKRTAQARRSIGVGITNLAHYMAKNKVKYSSKEGKTLVHRLAETHSFYLHKASLRLAKERGVCEWISKTKYPDGWLPIDTYCKEVDKICDARLQHDWETLRKEIVDFGGIRHSVLEAHMPCESSSGATNTTNGLYPIRNYRVIKTSDTNKNLFIAPDLEELKDYYEIAWNVGSKHLIDTYAIVQKFSGQGISADEYQVYNDEDGVRKVSAKQLLTNFLYLTKMGLKSRYYINSAAGVSIDKPEEIDISGICVGCSV